jgi:hypothetical protein
MQTPHVEDFATFKTRYQETRAALMGRCPFCELQAVFGEMFK